ncbi:MAG: formate dehydrogenase subunit alpha [Candidatus Acidiferrales bacterium]
MLHVAINGKRCEIEEGQTILSALRSLGIEIPTLCDDPRLKPIGGCRLCVVQVDGHPRPLTACDSAIAEGMNIETHTRVIEDWRRSLLRLLARKYPLSAVERFPEKHFHRLIRTYGLLQECGDGSAAEPIDDSNPYIHVDMSRCIYCFRCVRICEEVQGQFVWQVWNRGDATRIKPDSGTTLRESSCVSCGACVDTCPTGALEDQSVLLHGMATRWTKTTCAYCGTGCEMDVGTRDGLIVAIKPALEAPVNRGHLCVKGRYAFQFVYANDRVTQPMIRNQGSWTPVTWDEAIAFTAAEFQRLLAENGPRSIGVLGSARATNEENYLAQKFARLVLGTNNVDCCARVCHTPSAAALKLMLGTGAATNSFDDIEAARVILICGANPTENHPIVGARIKQAALRGTRLIVIDPRQIELAHYADIHLSPQPGANVPLLNALAHTIVEEELYDEIFLKEHVGGWPEFQKFIKSWSPESVAPLCGVKPGEIREAARLFAAEKPAMSFHGLGLTEHTQGTEGVMCLVNLALLTGNLGRAGTGINPLRGQNNVQGAAQMGCDPNNLTGAIPLDDGKSLFESVWHLPLPTAQGLNLMEMVDASLQGSLKGLWAIGYDILLTNPNASATEQALGSLQFIVVQDMFFNEIARKFGTVFLPVSSSFEKDGTFMNAERRIQRVRKVIEPRGESKSDWEIICRLASAMGKGELFRFRSPEEIWDEIRTVWKAASGITYARIEREGLQWPCTSVDHPGTTILYTPGSPAEKRPELRRIEYRPTKETTAEDYPFLLTTGRTLYQFNSGTMTSRTANSELRPEDCLDISAEDAERLRLQNGCEVRIRSRYGSANLHVNISRAVKSGELFATFHTPEVFLNFITGPGRDGYVSAPEYKRTAVRIEKI